MDWKQTREPSQRDAAAELALEMPPIPVLGGPSSTPASRAARSRRSNRRRASDAAAAKATTAELQRSANAPLELPRLDDFSVEQNSARFIRRSRWVSVDIGAFPVRVVMCCVFSSSLCFVDVVG